MLFRWFAWGLPLGIVFAAQWVEGAGGGSWVTIVTAVLCTVIFVLSLFRGEREITPVDWIGLIASLVALALWKLTKDPLGAVVLITLSNVLGFVPTIRKTLTKPGEEFSACMRWAA